MKISKMIEEWEKGCSCATPGTPEECMACTRGLVEAIAKRLTEPHYAAAEIADEAPRKQSHTH